MMKMSRYPACGYGNIQNMSIEQHDEAEYPGCEYSDTQKRSGAADLIQVQGGQIRRMTAEEYLIEKMRSDADGQKDS